MSKKKETDVTYHVDKKGFLYRLSRTSTGGKRRSGGSAADDVEVSGGGKVKKTYVRERDALPDNLVIQDYVTAGRAGGSAIPAEDRHAGKGGHGGGGGGGGGGGHAHWGGGGGGGGGGGHWNGGHGGGGNWNNGRFWNGFAWVLPTVAAASLYGLAASQQQPYIVQQAAPAAVPVGRLTLVNLTNGRQAYQDVNGTLWYRDVNGGYYLVR